MDNNLVENYANAIRARPVIKLLPDGLREYAQQFEVILLDDIRVQAGKQDMTESEALALAPSMVSKVIKILLPVFAEIALALLKKYAPTIAASGTIGAIIATYLTK